MKDDRKLQKQHKNLQTLPVS